MEHSRVGGMPRRSDYAPIPTNEPQEHYGLRQEAEDDSPQDNWCQSFARLAVGCPSSPRRDDDESLMETGMGRLDRNRARRAGPRDEVRQKLCADIERLQRNIAERNERNDHRRERLEGLKAQDEAGKWEDELYLARAQELDDARTRIQTSSSVSMKDVLDKVFKLNQKISHIASELVGAPLSGKKRPELNVTDTIQKILGKAFVFLFKNDMSPALGDRQLVQGVLQILLARSCVEVIDCWSLGRNPINRGMNKLYDRILKQETQMVAGKWRQLAFGKMPPGWPLEKCASAKATQVLDVLACAGWGGGIPQVQPLIKELMVMADELRKQVKGDVISSDLYPWVATPGKDYNDSTMKDVTHEVGMEKKSELGLHVLGSTEIGLKVCWKTQDSMLASSPAFRTRVLCIEPLRRRLQGTQKQIPPSSDSSPRRLTRGRSFSVS